MKTLWITTFNNKLYNLSGQRMIESFLKTQKDDIFIGCEGQDLGLKEFDSNQQVKSLDITEETDLWDKTNEDIIPVELGGKCTEDLDKDILPKYGSRFNSRAKHFYRKVLTIDAALSFTRHSKGNSYDYYIFVDCDTVFHTRIPRVLLESIAEYDLVYHLGPFRRKQNMGVETGIVGFKPTSLVVQKWTNAYYDDNFRTYERWDDSFVLQKKIQQHEQYIAVNQGNFKEDKMLDLVKNVAEPMQDVVGHGPFSGYISHMKGSHKQKLGEMCNGS